MSAAYDNLDFFKKNANRKKSNSKRGSKRNPAAKFDQNKTQKTNKLYP
jgi:hypothetical protein